ncbi:hypothetical protein ColKHC_11737 [Colletotrichum higginsianum]|nr:hypothetical protein ColKHC_11737 [Colletotrichum higginsianum]
MSNDPSVRRILPQSSQMGSFSFAPQQYPQRETQKNYVFVDEHNRHKRLKGMLTYPTLLSHAQLNTN